MFGLHFKSLLPAIIFSLCILEMSFGLSVSFRVVWWFYFYFVWSISNLNIKQRVDNGLTKSNMQVVIWYLLSCLIFTLQHFLGEEFYQQSTTESFNILWWSIFGLCWFIRWDRAKSIMVYFRYMSVISFFLVVVFPP